MDLLQGNNLGGGGCAHTEDLTQQSRFANGGECQEVAPDCGLALLDPTMAQRIRGIPGGRGPRGESAGPAFRPVTNKPHRRVRSRLPLGLPHSPNRSIAMTGKFQISFASVDFRALALEKVPALRTLHPALRTDPLLSGRGHPTLDCERNRSSFVPSPPGHCATSGCLVAQELADTPARKTDSLPAASGGTKLGAIGPTISAQIRGLRAVGCDVRYGQRAGCQPHANCSEADID